MSKSTPEELNAAMTKATRRRRRPAPSSAATLITDWLAAKAELDAKLEGVNLCVTRMEAVRTVLMEQFGIIVPAVTEVRTAQAPAAAPFTEVSRWQPPAQLSIDGQTPAVDARSVEEIREGAAIEGADEADFARRVAGSLDAVRRSFMMGGTQ